MLWHWQRAINKWDMDFRYGSSVWTFTGLFWGWNELTWTVPKKCLEQSLAHIST